MKLAAVFSPGSQTQIKPIADIEGERAGDLHIQIPPKKPKKSSPKKAAPSKTKAKVAATAKKPAPIAKKVEYPIEESEQSLLEVKDKSEPAHSSRYITPPRKQHPFSHFSLPPAPSIAEPEPMPAPEEIAAPALAEVEMAFAPIEKETEPTPAKEEAAPEAALAVTESLFEPPPPETIVVSEDDGKPSLSAGEAEVSMNSSLFEEREAAPLAENKEAPLIAVPLLTEEETAPVNPLPPNLAWLEKQTPFGENLKGMVSILRDAKTRIVCDLEQLRKRQKNLEAELFQVQYSVEQKKDDLRQLDNTISACALVAEQSTGIQPGLLALNGTHHRKPTNGAGKHIPHTFGKNDPGTLHLDEIRKFFAENPDTNWTAGEICKQLPESKQEHGKTYLSTALTNLTQMEEIQRVDRGIYRLIKK